MSTFRSEKENETGDRQRNEETNPIITAERVLTEEDEEKSQDWRAADIGTGNRGEPSGTAAQPTLQQQTGDPGRMPGKAEGVEDPEESGNE